ncbi:MAG: ATP-binding protein [Candidatus Pedobacter colombiensis]|uniref:ATP-binding protein n=1 Tax=Candidatus Pedobacter colombiensis TaxID=3121371 RepID=A0AAJ6B557_9SPHI|nr:ATP-binding protein [Pedobacter sp.]WEK17434.1 MAG: ATP-binding protein [Pedobacter sp.]
MIKDAGITSACHLLFSKNDVFSAVIELGRFSTPTSIKDGMTIRSDLFSEVELVLDFIKKHINKEYIITGDPQREERWEYPLQAIREIVINMIVHRDYMHSGDSSVKVYNDRIEFFNFGRLPEGFSIAQLISGYYISSVRNKMIASTFKEAQLIEKYGSGIKRIQEGFVNYGLKEPFFEEFQGGFRVIVYSEIKQFIANSLDDKVGVKVGAKVGVKVGVKLSKNQIKIIIEMQKNKNITFSRLSKLIGVSEVSIYRNVKKLIKMQIIDRIGSDKTGYWQINEITR